MKSQNCLNLRMAMKALLFIFSNTVIRLGFLCAFLSSSISIKKHSLYFLQHNTDYVSAAAFGGLFHIMSRIFSMRRRCSVPLEMI